MRTTDLSLAITDDHLDAAIAHLRSLHRHAFLQYVVAVGQVIVERFFHGSFSTLHASDPTKLLSFQALVTRRRTELAELGLSAPTLRRYVLATEVWHGLPEHTRSRLGLDHLQRLAVVADLPARSRLAHDAATMQWTREQVGIAVAEYKKEQRHGKAKTGRKPRPAVLKAAVSLHLAARKLLKLHGGATQLGAAHAQALQAELAAVRAVLVRLEAAT